VLCAAKPRFVSTLNFGRLHLRATLARSRNSGMKGTPRAFSARRSEERVGLFVRCVRCVLLVPRGAVRRFSPFSVVRSSDSALG